MRMPKPKAGAFSRALVDLIETRLRALRLSVHAAEKRYGFPPESLRSVLKGSSPSVDRFKKICDALEIDFTLGATLDATPLGATPLGSTLGETPLGATPLGATLPTKLPTNFGGKVGGKVGGIVGGIVGGKVVRGRKGLGHAGRMGGREDGGKIDSCLEGVGIDASSVASSLHRVGESQDCPIVGIVRAGSEIEYWNDQFPGGENISVPGELFGDSGARRWGGVVVRGESMSPIFDDGDILFFARHALFAGAGSVMACFTINRLRLFCRTAALWRRPKGMKRLERDRGCTLGVASTCCTKRDNLNHLLLGGRTFEPIDRRRRALQHMSAKQGGKP